MTTSHNQHTQQREPIMTTATIPFPAPRRGLYVAFQRVGLGWRWRCLHCGAAGTGHTDELALAAAAAHPCADKEVQA